MTSTPVHMCAHRSIRGCAHLCTPVHTYAQVCTTAEQGVCTLVHTSKHSGKSIGFSTFSLFGPTQPPHVPSTPVHKCAPRCIRGCAHLCTPVHKCAHQPKRGCSHMCTPQKIMVKPMVFQHFRFSAPPSPHMYPAHLCTSVHTGLQGGVHTCAHLCTNVHTCLKGGVHTCAHLKQYW